MTNDEYSVLVGGQAGDGIKQAGNSIGRLFNRLGYWVFVYEDYPSLIRGGHNFAIVRAKPTEIHAHRDMVDVLIALNQESVERHKWRLKPRSLVVFDQSKVKADGLGPPMSETAKSRGLPSIVRNTVALGSLASVVGVGFESVEDVIRSSITKRVDENIAVAKEGYDMAEDHRGTIRVPPVKGGPRPLLSGNEAIALGAVRAGLKLYVAYPMTPSSSILHYLSANADRLNVVVVHPENEIAVIGMAEGAAYAGARTMVGTSGGGFALMVEHLSLAGQAEIPVPIVLAQRPGPSTGVPTHTAQGDLLFALFAGHGEFPRVLMAPGDAEEAFHLSADALNLAWKFQVPVILMSDKHLSESTYSTELDEDRVKVEPFPVWRGDGQYKRYSQADGSISLLAFPGTDGAIVKLNSYEHDEYGVTTEEPELIRRGHDKRLGKTKLIEAELRKRQTVRVFGDIASRRVIVTWGSTRGAVVEAAAGQSLKVVQPLYLSPLPIWELSSHFENVEKVVCVEANSTAQLSTWLAFHGLGVDENVLKYDGRPFTVDQLEEEIKEVFS